MGNKAEAAYYDPRDPDRFARKAKACVLEATKACPSHKGFTEKDFYVVWFSKTLQNWKALISTDELDGMYYEVTYNGNKEEAYVDVYAKCANVVITDKHLGSTDH